MSVQWPRVKAGIVAGLSARPAWAGVSVISGPQTTSDTPLRWVTVGATVEDDSAGSWSSTLDTSGFEYVETGAVLAELSCVSGDDDYPATEAAAFALADDADAMVRADRTLGGVLSSNGTCDVSATVRPLLNDNGTGVSLVLTFSYYTVT